MVQIYFTANLKQNTGGTEYNAGAINPASIEIVQMIMVDYSEE